jgi:hypothetical protein
MFMRLLSSDPASAPAPFRTPLHRGPCRPQQEEEARRRVVDSGDVRPSRRLSGNAFYHRKRRTAADVLVSPRKLPVLCFLFDETVVAVAC